MVLTVRTQIIVIFHYEYKSLQPSQIGTKSRYTTWSWDSPLGPVLVPKKAPPWVYHIKIDYDSIMFHIKIDYLVPPNRMHIWCLQF